MLLNNDRCRNLTVKYVNNASGLELHRFHWLANEEEIGTLDKKWNHLVDVQSSSPSNNSESNATLLHWTLGGPWFKDQRTMGGHLAAEWFSARDESMKLWD